MLGFSRLGINDNRIMVAHKRLWLLIGFDFLSGYNRSREDFRLPSLRTVRAGLPHTALQSVVSSSGLARQRMGFRHGEKTLRSEEGIGSATVIRFGTSCSAMQGVLSA